MKRLPKMRSPGRLAGRTGAGANEAGASNNSNDDLTPRTVQVQRLVSRHALQPSYAAIVAPLAFGEAGQ